MHRYEELRQWVLKTAGSGGREAVHVRTSVEARPLEVSKDDLEQILVEMAEDKLIYLAAWDGGRERPYDEWTSLQEFFASPLDGGYVRLRLLLKGAELLDALPRSPIGFVPGSG